MQNTVKLYTLMLTALMCCGMLIAPAQTAAKKGDENYINKIGSTVLATVGSEEVTYSDLERAYRKNMNRGTSQLWEIDKDSVLEFLNLYINYRLKVQDAISRKVDQDPAVQAEIIRNRNAIAIPTYFEKMVMTPQVDVMWERRKEERQLRVILVGLQQSENPDTTKAHRRAEDALNRLKGGASFATVAAEFSDDPLSREKDGLIPFATSGQILRQLEDAMYSLKPGELYPNLIRTRSGYFIVKLEAVQPLELVKASHILIMENSQRSAEEAIAKADSLRALIDRGVPFDQLVKDNSDDNQTSSKGGQLPGGYYSRSLGFIAGEGRLTPEFEEAMFALKAGEISQPIKTVYGVHIIRLDSVASYHEVAERKDIEKRYKDLYFEEDKENLLQKLREEHSQKLRNTVFAELLAAVDTTRTSNATDFDVNVSDALGNKVLFDLGEDGRFLVGGFIDSLKSRADLRNTRLNSGGMLAALHKMSDEKLMARVTDGMEERYPEFGALMREFRDGILIFRVENEKVWSRLTFDSTRARQYWEQNKSRFVTDTLYDLSEIYVYADSTAQDLYKQIENGASFDELAAKHTMRQGYRERNGRRDVRPRDQSALAIRAVDMGLKIGEIGKPFQFEQGYSIVRVNAITPPRVKTYDEALPEFAAEVQDMMQKEFIEEWLSELRGSHKIVVKNDVINDIWEQ